MTKNKKKSPKKNKNLILDEEIEYWEYEESKLKSYYDNYNHLSSKEKINFENKFSKPKNKSQENYLKELNKKDNKIDPKSISDLLGIEEKTVIKTISNLVDDGYLKEYKDYLKPTADGKELASESKIDEYEIRYSYELDPEATHQGKEILETSHEFCKKMFSGAKKYFLRSEIDTLSNRLGYNVWEMRGGWQTIKGNTHIPHCRHIWEAHKVKRK